MKVDIKNAVLVGIQLPKINTEDFQSSLQELQRLVTTLGYPVVGSVVQRRDSDRSPSVLGEGKLKELAKWTGGSGQVAAMFEAKLTKAALKWKEEEEDSVDTENTDDSDNNEDTLDENLSTIKKKSAQIVIVDTELSPSQIRNLESASGVQVLDRTGVIIEIFSRHARTRTARLQVEIARLTYVAPRIRETGGGEDRGGGGVGGKGAGESSLELDRRKIRDRIKELKIELASIGNEHQTRRARREHELSVALVGYTNAGKSSLMRALTGSEVLIADKLFATLDTTIRPMYPETTPKVLISDTVGFIKKLPHDLVASFKSTLDEALSSSLLLFVVDSSDPAFRSQLGVTMSVLEEVGAHDIPRLLILNKKDQLSDQEHADLKHEFPDSIAISTREKNDIKMLQDRIMTYFETDMIDVDLFIPYLAKGLVGDLRAKLRVLGESYSEFGTTYKVRGPQDVIEQIQKKIPIEKSQRTRK